MDRTDFEMELLEKVVKKAWEDEKLIFKLIHNKDVDEREPLCQGLSSNLERRLNGVFHCAKIYFTVKEKSHVALIVVGEETYVVDATIRQFLPDETKTVFKTKDYPLSENHEFPHLQTWG